MLNDYTYAKNPKSHIYYCSKKNKGCKARVKLDRNGIIINKAEDSTHFHPPPKYYQTSSGEYIKLSS
ncbi:unnamed protein product [Euphydryas editha]|uniref:FLYWCH-type domain-containing protein n=1 Tax=Euphydryas editha TaxID=104508 RepID=A0AAU9TI14_EUPED|nr:unnamed protein product [Euphydryas editha]